LLRHIPDPIRFGGVDQYFAQVGFLFFEHLLLLDVGDLVGRMTIRDWTARRRRCDTAIFDLMSRGDIVAELAAGRCRRASSCVKHALRSSNIGSTHSPLPVLRRAMHVEFALKQVIEERMVERRTTGAACPSGC
jgi:hypothetical protein